LGPALPADVEYGRTGREAFYTHRAFPKSLFTYGQNDRKMIQYSDEYEN